MTYTDQFTPCKKEFETNLLKLAPSLAPDVDRVNYIERFTSWQKKTDLSFDGVGKTNEEQVFYLYPYTDADGFKYDLDDIFHALSADGIAIRESIVDNYVDKCLKLTQ